MALGIFGGVSAFATSEGSGFAPLYTTESHFASTQPHAFTSVQRGTDGIHYHVHTVIDPAFTPEGRPAQVRIYVFNDLSQCHPTAISLCSPSQLGLAQPVDDGTAYADSNGNLEVGGAIPAGAALSNPLGSEVWITLRVWKPGTTGLVLRTEQLSIQDPVDLTGTHGNAAQNAFDIDG